MSSSFSFPSFLSCYLRLLVVLALFHLSLCNRNFYDVLCIDDERQALLEFKLGLIEEAGLLASWVGEDCCRWDGIVCDNFTGHVHRIHLRGAGGHCHFKHYSTIKEYEEYNEALKQRLRGNLSSSLLHLKQLNHLDLSCNDFGGIQVPSFIGSLRNLRYLNLSLSGFGGIIPPQLGNLSELRVLSLGKFTDYPDVLESTSMLKMECLSGLHLLQHLDMSGMNLSKAIDWLKVINTLTSLVELHLSRSQLINIHGHVSALNITSLSVLDLSFNKFNSYVPPWIFSITSLVSLDLSSCNFYSPIPSSIDSFRNLTSLELLHVSGNDFISSSLVLKGLSTTIGSNLISIDISSCGVSSSVLNNLHNLTSLLSLDLSGNPITKTIPKSLSNLCNLREINLSSMNFSNISLTYLLRSLFECKSPRLESLSLVFSGISGHLPYQLGQFIHLVHLQVDDNYLTGTIPYAIGQLSFLRSLHLNFNLISGPIPHSVGQLSSLEVLYLSNNHLHGSLPDSIGQLSSLEVLDLSSNQLDGNLPNSIGRLSLLEELDLSTNQLNGSLPNSLGQLSNLKYLDISNNKLTGIMTEAHFAKLASLIYLIGTRNSLLLRPRVGNWIPCFQLQYLYLNSWGLGPQFPLWLRTQRDLKYLDISNTNILAPMPPSFWRSFPNLIYLDMSKNRIRGTLTGIPATLDLLLDFSSNELTGQLPHLSNGSVPLFLDLSNNFFAGSLHHFLCSYDMKTTEFLNLGNNHLRGLIPDCLEKWPHLKYLDLENNSLSGGIPRTLESLSDLRFLNMYENKLSGRLPASLMNLSRLEVLELGRNDLVGNIPPWSWRKHSFLSIFNLRWNNLDGNIPHEMCYLTSIQILDLSHNNLSGNIPGCFNNFNVLSGKEAISYGGYRLAGKEMLASESLLIKGREDTYSTILALVMMLDLSSNNFSGHIPSELTALQELKSLNLSRNQLTGPIPENIGDMKSLESLDVSLNNISGELPISLTSLSFLSSFNVSYNNLTGRIPSSTQLQSFNEFSFFGNKLCGDPLTEHCTVEVADRDQGKDNASHGSEWGFIISMLFGFVAGFLIVVGPLIVSRSWRIAYFHFLSKLTFMVYDVMHKHCCNMFSE